MDSPTFSDANSRAMPVTRAIWAPAETPKEKFEETVYRALRNYQDGKFITSGVTVGQLDQRLTSVYDTIVAALVTALLDSAPKRPYRLLVRRGEKFHIDVAGPYQGVADPVGMIDGEAYDCEINESGDLVISAWESNVLAS